MASTISAAILVTFLAAEPPSHVPIHEPDRVFRPDDVRHALSDSQELASLKDIVRKLDGDPEKLKRLANFAELVQKFRPKQSEDLAKMSPALRSIAEKLKNSDFQRKLFNDPAMRRAAERLAQKPEMRQLVEKMAETFSDPQGKLQSQVQELSNGVKPLIEQSDEPPPVNDPPTPPSVTPRGKNSVTQDRGAESEPTITRQPEPEAPAETGPSKSPIAGIFDRLGINKSRYVQDTIRKLGPERLLDQAIRTKSASTDESSTRSLLLEKSQSMIGVLANRTRGLEKWGRQATAALQARMPAMPKIPVPKVNVPRFSIPTPPMPQLSVPQFSPSTLSAGRGSWGGGIIVFGAVIAAAIVLLLWRLEKAPALFKRPFSANGIPRRRKRGSDDRSRICDLFETTALAVLGEKARPEHHRRIAEQLAETGNRDAVLAFAQLYETARYADDEPLQDNALPQAIQYAAAVGERAR